MDEKEKQVATSIVYEFPFHHGDKFLIGGSKYMTIKLPKSGKKLKLSFRQQLKYLLNFEDDYIDEGKRKGHVSLEEVNLHLGEKYRRW